MGNSNAQAHEPDAQSSVVAATARAPGRTVVTRDALRQTVTAKDLDQSCLRNVSGVSGAGLQSDGKARMVIEDGQRVTTSLGKFELAFEVHLPKFIRCSSLEALKGLMLGRLFGVE